MGRCALLTIQRDEHFILPLWLRYYSQHFAAQDIYILDHESTEPSVVAELASFQGRGGHVLPVYHPRVYASAEDVKLNTAGGFIRDSAAREAARLQGLYEYVLYTDSDELVIPREGRLDDFIAHADQPQYRCTGREVVESSQHWHPDFDKVLLSDHPLQWSWGFHYTTPEYPVGDDLWLYHLHRLDFEQAWSKARRWHGGGWSEAEAQGHRELFRAWFYAIHTSARTDRHLGQRLQPLDGRISGVLSQLGALPPPSSAFSDTFPAWQVPNSSHYAR